MWFLIAAIVVIGAVTLLTRPKVPTNTIEPGNFEIPKAEEGEPLKKFFGTCVVRDPVVVWWGDTKIEPIKEKGGKK